MKGCKTMNIICYKYNGKYYTAAQIWQRIDLMLYRKRKGGKFDQEKYDALHRALKTPVWVDENKVKNQKTDPLF